MLLAIFDFETDGLDVEKDHPVEVGVILYTTTFKRVVMAESFLVDNEIPISKELTEIHKVTTGMATKFGLVPGDGLSRLQNYFDMADTIVGKNIVDFDLPMYRSWCKRENVEPISKPVIDIETDLPGVESKKLSYMAADAGFLNPFPHASLPDAWTSLRLIELQPDFNKVVERAKSPRVYVKAHVDFDSNYLAKERKYRWDPTTKTWFKIIKEMDLQQEGADCTFDISVIEPLVRHESWKKQEVNR